MKALILKNAYYDAPPYAHQCARIRQELIKAGVACDVRANDFFPAIVSDGEIAARTAGYDFCVYLDKDKYASEMLEKSGLRLFNTHEAIAACDDKMLTFIRLAGHGVPMPATLPAPLCYTPAARVSSAEAEQVCAALGLPVVVKLTHGSMGKGVFRADDRAALLALMEEHKLAPHLYQKYVSSSAGRDLRVIVVGGHAAGAMLRVAAGDFRSNVGAGGRGEPFPLDDETAALCERVAALLGLDFCGVDLLFGPNGFEVCEVNSNAFFAAFEQVTGINVAAAYVEHMIIKMQNI